MHSYHQFVETLKIWKLVTVFIHVILIIKLIHVACNITMLVLQNKKLADCLWIHTILHVMLCTSRSGSVDEYCCLVWLRSCNTSLPDTESHSRMPSLTYSASVLWLIILAPPYLPKI